MKERPILFKDEMIRAILEGRKTQTRRVVKPQPERSGDGVLMWGASKKGMRFGVQGMDLPPGVFARCPYGKPGDRLWVRETHAIDGSIVRYHATDNVNELRRKRPSIHMPRWASRITLEITSVRVERLQDISEADAIAEGVEGHYIEDGWYWRDYLLTDEDAAISPMLTCPKESFRSLWQSINGPSSRNENPWVWVVEFKRVQP